MALRLKNKRAMFFTMMAIIVLSVFLLSYTIYSATEDRKVINKRISSMNDFVFSLEKDISRQGYISGYRAILALEFHITANGTFLTNAESSIKEALLNGTIEGQPINLMEGYKLGEWNSRIQDSGNKMNLFINYSLKNISVIQEDPWNVNINLEVELFIKDKSNLALWNKTETITSKIEITNFEDPLYIVHTSGLVANKIKKTIYHPFANGADVTNLSLHSQSSYYIASVSGPSFLNRLEGKNFPNANGIESLVYLPELSAQDLTTYNKTCVDYIYFSNDNPVSHNIQGMPSWFRIDNAHLEAYNVAGLMV